MLIRLYHTRFSEQIETADAETILSRFEATLCCHHYIRAWGGICSQ